LSNKYNQVKAKKIKSAGQQDHRITAEIESFLVSNNLATLNNPYVLLDGMYGTLVDIRTWLDEETVTSKKFIIHHPDLLVQLPGKILIIELDGDIHIKKSQKTIDRNKDYEFAKIDFIAVPLYDLKELKIPYLDFIKDELKKRGLI